MSVTLDRVDRQKMYSMRGSPHSNPRTVSHDPCDHFIYRAKLRTPEIPAKG